MTDILCNLDLSENVWLYASIAGGVLLVIVMLLNIKHPPAGNALLKSGMFGKSIKTGPTVALPILTKVRKIDLTNRMISLDLTGENAAADCDSQKVDCKVSMVLNLPADANEIEKVIAELGQDVLADNLAVKARFSPLLCKAATNAIAQHTASELYNYQKKTELRDSIINSIKPEIYGFQIADLTIEFFEPVEMSQLERASSTSSRTNSLDGNVQGTPSV